MRHSIALAALFAVMTSAANAQTAVGAATGACGRECLRGFITQHLDAMIRHEYRSGKA